MTVRNEELYLSRAIEHLYGQGIDTCLIDNESTDSTLKIAKDYLNRGIFRIESIPYNGFFELAKILACEEQLTKEIEADWFIHHDADEIRQACAPYKTLYEGINAVDGLGYNAINFDEFVFLPTSDDESFEGTDYVEKMRYYYFFEPAPLRHIKAWKNSAQLLDFVASGGHMANFADRKIYPVNFILRHYIALSRAQVINKYGKRKYSPEEIEQRGWHRARARFNPLQLQLPGRHRLKFLSDDSNLDKSEPWTSHALFANK